MKMGFSYTVDKSTHRGRQILWVTKGVAGHTLVRFQNGTRLLYFESIWSVDEVTKKTGVRGPRDYRLVKEWYNKDKENRVLIEQPWLPVTAEEAFAAFEFLSGAVHRIKYSKIQLAGNFLQQRIGFIIRLGRTGSRNAWTCSETAARCLPPRLSHRYLMLGDLLYDNIVPSSTKYPGGLLEACDIMIRDNK